MAGAVLVPCGVRLRSDFDALAPGRDHASDGWIGDTAHQQEVSDHNPDETGSVPIHDADKVNEVHAIDVDADLRTPGLTMWDVVDFLVSRCRAGSETRLRYIIWDHIIWEASNGWRSRPYTGASPHTEHAHFSFSYDTAREASTASWHLEDIPVALTAADKAWLTAELERVVEQKIIDRPISDYLPGDQPARSLYDWTADTNVRQQEIVGKLDQIIEAVKPEA